MLALVDKQPRLLSLKRALQIHIDHRFEVITRRTRFDLDKALKRQHILEGLLIALDNLDEVIKTIRSSPDADEARGKLMESFGLTEVQATAILDMQLRRLAALERQKIEDEYAEITAHIEYLRSLLDDKKKILALITEDLQELKEKYGDARRSQIAFGLAEDINMEDLIKDEDVFISITQRGYVKRTPVTAYRVQGRGGKGLIGMTTRDEDQLEHLFAAGTLNSILFFSNHGKVYAIKAYEIPELDRTAKGTNLMNILPLMPEEKITAVLPVHNFEDAEYLMMVTRLGRIKRTEISQFANVRPSGLIAIGLDDGDSLGWVKMTHGDNDIIIVSEQGRGIRFSEEDVRPMGRNAAGVYGIRLDTWDRVAGAGVVETGEDLLIITEKGYGKRTSLDDYRQQNRYGQGVRAMTLTPERTGKIISARVIAKEDEVTCISSKGIILRTAANVISQQGRITQGVRVMDLRKGDIVASVAVLREGQLSRVGEELTVNGESMNGEENGVETAVMNDIPNIPTNN
jgi:DNA gyrase subunit A